MNENVKTYPEVVVSERSFFSRVYFWMTIGLVLTALTALYVVASPELMIRLLSNEILFYGLLIGELALVWYMSARVQKMSFAQLSLGMLIYAIINGITLSLIFVVYTSTSIASTFFVTAGMFGAMSIYGYSTKRDLTGVGHFCFMGLIGLIIASVINIFLFNDMFSFVISCVGVVVFVGLTAYDTQKLKNIASIGVETEDGKKMAMMGALELYLDFINLFLFILRLLGRRR